MNAIHLMDLNPRSYFLPPLSLLLSYQYLLTPPILNLYSPLIFSLLILCSSIIVYCLLVPPFFSSPSAYITFFLLTLLSFLTHVLFYPSPSLLLYPPPRYNLIYHDIRITTITKITNVNIILHFKCQNNGRK